MFGFKRKAAPELVTVVDGEVISIEAVSDPVFASKAVGDGFAVRPTSGAVVSPVDGEIISVFPTKHAITLRSSGGLEILIHLGIDTVKLDGEGFEVSVAAGDKVKAGQPVATMDLAGIAGKGVETTTMVLITNLEGKGVKLTTGTAAAGTPVLTVA